MHITLPADPRVAEIYQQGAKDISYFQPNFFCQVFALSAISTVLIEYIALSKTKKKRLILVYSAGQEHFFEYLLYLLTDAMLAF